MARQPAAVIPSEPEQEWRCMMGSVPNKPKTTLRNVRIDNQLWGDALIVTRANGTNISEVIRHALWEYILENDHGPDYTETHRAG